MIPTLRIENTESNWNGCPGKLKLTSDGPAIFDAPISINATIENAHDFEGPFYFTFGKYNIRIRVCLLSYQQRLMVRYIFILVDDVSPMHYKELTSNDGMQTATFDYPYKEYDIEGNVFEIAMTVMVYETKSIFWRKKIATGTIRYNITKSLNGKIDVTQVNRTISTDEDKYSIVSTQNITKLNVDLYDPHGNIQSMIS